MSSRPVFRVLAPLALAAAAVTAVDASAFAAPANHTTLHAAFTTDTAARAHLAASNKLGPQLGSCSGPYGDFEFFCQFLTPTSLFVLCGDDELLEGTFPAGIYTITGYCPGGVYEWATS
jgi:hypothetical protein